MFTGFFTFFFVGQDVSDSASAYLATRLTLSWFGIGLSSALHELEFSFEQAFRFFILLYGIDFNFTSCLSLFPPVLALSIFVRLLTVDSWLS